MINASYIVPKTINQETLEPKQVGNFCKQE